MFGLINPPSGLQAHQSCDCRNCTSTMRLHFDLTRLLNRASKLGKGKQALVGPDAFSLQTVERLKCDAQVSVNTLVESALAEAPLCREQGVGQAFCQLQLNYWGSLCLSAD